MKRFKHIRGSNWYAPKREQVNLKLNDFPYKNLGLPKVEKFYKLNSKPQLKQKGNNI